MLRRRYFTIDDALDEILEWEGDTIFGQEASGRTSHSVECSASAAGELIGTVVRAAVNESDGGDGYADHFLDLEIDTIVTARPFVGNSGAQNNPDDEDDEEGSGRVSNYHSVLKRKFLY